MSQGHPRPEVVSADGSGPGVVAGDLRDPGAGGGSVGRDRGGEVDRALAELPGWLREAFSALLSASGPIGLVYTRKGRQRTAETLSEAVLTHAPIKGDGYSHGWFDEAVQWKTGPSIEGLMDDVIREVMGDEPEDPGHWSDERPPGIRWPGPPGPGGHGVPRLWG